MHGVVIIAVLLLGVLGGLSPADATHLCTERIQCTALEGNCWLYWEGFCAAPGGGPDPHGPGSFYCYGDVTPCIEEFYRSRCDNIHVSCGCGWQPMVLEGQPTHPCTRPPRFEPFYTEEQKIVFGKAKVRLAASAVTFQGISMAVPNAAVKAAIRAAAWAQTAGAALFALLEIDPPDPNFKILAPVTPIPVDPPIVAKGLAISAQQAAAFNAWLDNVVRMNALMTAMNTTLDRAEGARAAVPPNTKWYTKQVLYYNTLQLDLARATYADLPLRQAFAQVPHGKFPADFYTAFLDPVLMKRLTTTSIQLRLP
jgi:hypothetical protein